MKKTILTLSIAFISLTYSCKDQKKKPNEAPKMEASAENDNEMAEESTTIALEPKSDSNVKGEITFTQKDNEVTMIAHLSGLKEGEHAIHIHETADCSSEDGKSAGGHWNPTDQPHGKWGAKEGYHKGDIGNFTANADGVAEIEFSTDEWCMDCDDDTMNILGKGVIVHEGVDDYTSQPSGGAGTRVSCAGIIQ